MKADDIFAENRRLNDYVSRLQAEIVTLKRKVAILEKHEILAQGIKGESLVAVWVNGVVTTHNASHDIDIQDRTLSIEVKYAGLNSAVRGRGSRTTETLRWAWSKPFGESGSKTYDKLILVGDTDARYAQNYKDPTCPYVIFDVPFEDIMPLTIQTNSGRYRSIQLTTNPLTARSSASALFSNYQVTTKELEDRYGF